MPKKSTTEEFITKAKLVHGDKYDYSLVEYVGSKSNIIVICKKHDEFPQAPTNHLRGVGCPKCVGKNKTTEEFISEAKLVHGDKYDYSLVNYIKNSTQVKIICKTHGWYPQSPKSHLSGAGCPKCVGMNKTTEEFISEAKLVHGDKYDYSLVEYINATDNIKIICKTHGEFPQTPSKHLNGSGCSKCIGRNKTTEEFISEAKLVHDDKFDYSLVEYVNSTDNIKIICKTHGWFPQSPGAHLQGAGCPKCANKNVTTNEFITKAKLVHGDKYDYSLTKYVNSKLNVDIICPMHGVFPQLPNGHLNGCRCPYCTESKGESFIVNYLNLNNFNYIRGKKFNKCKNIRKLPFDFYLPEYNLLIEYDGRQHFIPVSIFGGEKSLKNQPINDEIKNNYAKDNNIKLLRIKFDEFNKINEILINILQNGH